MTRRANGGKHDHRRERQLLFWNLPAGDYVVMVDTTTRPVAEAVLFNTVDPDITDSRRVNLDYTRRRRDQPRPGLRLRAHHPNSIGGTIWDDVNADGPGSGETTIYQG